MAAPRLADLDISSVAATSFNFRPGQAATWSLVVDLIDGQLTVRSLRKICGNTQCGFRRKSVNLRSLSVMTRSFCIWCYSGADKFRFVDYLKMFDNFSHVSPQDPECCPKFIKWSNREKVYWKLNSLKNWTPCILEAQLFNFEELDWSYFRRACSSWWTARRCPGCGGCTRTSLTWTTRRWAGHSGKRLNIFGQE